MRPYTGFDKIADGKREGTEAMTKCLEQYFGLWNNGTFGVRKKRGKSSYSVHATARAGDNSWRGAPYRGTGNYDDAKRACEFLVRHADELGVEAVFDYYPEPWGRGWKCDRGAWKVYERRAFSGTPGGDWIHWELDNDAADDAARIRKVFERELGKGAKAPAKTAKKTARKPESTKIWLQVGSRGENVKRVQQVVGAYVDGQYGPKTEASVKAWQAEQDLYVDGIVGPKTWAAMGLD